MIAFLQEQASHVMSKPQHHENENSSSSFEVNHDDLSHHQQKYHHQHDTTTSAISPRQQKKSLKRVRFSNEDNKFQETLSLEDYTPQELLQTWYSEEEFMAIRTSALNVGKQVRTDASDRLQALIETFKAAQKLSSKINDEETLVAVQKNLDLSRAGLMQWVEDHQEAKKNLRGLEKFASLTIRKARQETREENSQIVFDSTIRTASSLSTRYQELSQPARIFARMMGLCDEMAAAAE